MTDWAGGWTTLPVISGSLSAVSADAAYAIDADGLVVYGAASAASRAVAARFTPLASAASINSGSYNSGSAHACSADGTIVYGRQGNGLDRAFRWSAIDGNTEIHP